MATTLRNEAKESVSWTPNVQRKAKQLGFTIVTMYKGLASKPTLRRETARLRSSVFKGSGNDEVFLTAWIVKMFNMVAV